MNFNKYALAMFAFAGIMTVMIGGIGTSSAQENQTSAGTMAPITKHLLAPWAPITKHLLALLGTDNQTSAGTMGTDNQTSAGTNASGQTSDNQTSIVDKLLKMLGMGGNK